MDRCYALWNKDNNFMKGKNIVSVFTYGDDDLFSSGCINAIRTFQDCYNYYKANYKDILHCKANEMGVINKNKEMLEKAYNLGLKISNY